MYTLITQLTVYSVLTVLTVSKKLVQRGSNEVKIHVFKIIHLYL